MDTETADPEAWVAVPAKVLVFPPPQARAVIIRQISISHKQGRIFAIFIWTPVPIPRER
jgi:hypothetical protein